MPRIRTPATITEWYLLRGKRADIIQQAGMTKSIYYNRKENPGELRLHEFGPLAKDLTDEQIVTIVRAWS